MSNYAHLVANAKRSGQMKKDGYDSLFDKHKEMDDRGYELWEKGMSATALRRILCNEFPHLVEIKELPSLQSFTNRIKKHWVKRRNPIEVKSISPYALKVEELLTELDPIVEVWKYVLPEAKKMYEASRDAKLTLKTRQESLKTYSSLLKMANDMLATSRVGLTAMSEMQTITGDNQTVNQQITNVTVINNQLSEDANKQNYKAVMSAFKRFQELENKMKSELKQAKEAEIVEKNGKAKK